jgi:hypothetical protein
MSAVQSGPDAAARKKTLLLAAVTLQHVTNQCLLHIVLLSQWMVQLVLSAGPTGIWVQLSGVLPGAAAAAMHNKTRSTTHSLLLFRGIIQVLEFTEHPGGWDVPNHIADPLPRLRCYAQLCWS